MKTLDVLLVEDNAGDALLTGQTLAQSNFPVKLHIARDGEQAMMMLADPDFHPALIILDLNIPRLPGALLLERMPKKDVPVVVFSSSWNETEIENALTRGAREFVQKPTDLEAFTQAVCAMVEKWAFPSAEPKANGAAADG